MASGARYRDTAGKEHARRVSRKIDAQHWLELGCLFVGVGSDTGILARQSEALAARFKSQTVGSS